MVSQKMMINSESGLDINPAAELAKAAESCSSRVEIIYKYNIINARSLLNILSASISKGDEITLCCTGPKEVQDLEKICELMKHL